MREHIGPTPLKNVLTVTENSDIQGAGLSIVVFTPQKKIQSRNKKIAESTVSSLSNQIQK